jgi:hypothetical protein
VRSVHDEVSTAVGPQPSCAAAAVKNFAEFFAELSAEGLQIRRCLLLYSVEGIDSPSVRTRRVFNGGRIESDFRGVLGRFRDCSLRNRCEGEEREIGLPESDTEPGDYITELDLSHEKGTKLAGVSFRDLYARVLRDERQHCHWLPGLLSELATTFPSRSSTSNINPS